MTFWNVWKINSSPSRYEWRPWLVFHHPSNLTHHLEAVKVKLQPSTNNTQNRVENYNFSFVRLLFWAQRRQYFVCFKSIMRFLFLFGSSSFLKIPEPLIRRRLGILRKKMCVKQRKTTLIIALILSRFSPFSDFVFYFLGSITNNLCYCCILRSSVHSSFLLNFSLEGWTESIEMLQRVCILWSDLNFSVCFLCLLLMQKLHKQVKVLLDALSTPSSFINDNQFYEHWTYENLSRLENDNSTKDNWCVIFYMRITEYRRW